MELKKNNYLNYNSNQNKNVNRFKAFEKKEGYLLKDDYKKIKMKGDCPKCGGVHHNCFCCVNGPENCPIHSHYIFKEDNEYDFILLSNK